MADRPPKSHPHDMAMNLRVVWEALADYRDKIIPEGTRAHDAQWEEICEAMGWMAEDMGVETESL